MGFEILHQVGHNATWNIKSFEGGVGDGLILSPVHQERQTLEKLGADIRAQSIFDPQYYLPSSQKSKLKSYPFFPEAISGGFSTANFSAVAHESARQCLEFQIEQKFGKVVIPMRYLDQMYPDYVERQEQITLQPFLAAIESLGIEEEIVLTLPITNHMIENEIFRTRILNWITKYSEISRIYLIYAYERETKQIQSESFLTHLLDFVREVQNTGLKITIGYQNTESLLFSIFDDISLAIGTFENTRVFSIDKYLVTDEERRGPRPRIYLNGLLNWIQYDEAMTIRQRFKNVWANVYSPSQHADEVLARAAEPHFSQPDLYLHHLVSIQAQFDELKKLKQRDRFRTLRDWLTRASDQYTLIEDNMMLDRHGRGTHITPWFNALRSFEKKYS